MLETRVRDVAAARHFADRNVMKHPMPMTKRARLPHASPKTTQATTWLPTVITAIQPVCVIKIK